MGVLPLEKRCWITHDKAEGVARGWDNTCDDPRSLEGEKMDAIALQRDWGWGLSLLGLQKTTCLEWG